jgi:hypothetical protein
MNITQSFHSDISNPFERFTRSIDKPLGYMRHKMTAPTGSQGADTWIREPHRHLMLSSPWGHGCAPIDIVPKVSMNNKYIENCCDIQQQYTVDDLT